MTSKNFAVLTERNVKVRETAEHVQQWAANNPAAFEGGCRLLVALLIPCLAIRQTRNQREKVWRKFHQIRTSPSLKFTWDTFLTTAQMDAKTVDPIFPQFVTQHLIESMMKVVFSTQQQVPETEMESTEIASLSKEEENALRYAAGFIPRALRKKLERSSHPLKEEFIICLMELCMEDEVSDDTNFVTYTTEWISRINRGGLYEVNNMTYLLFREVELEFRRHMNKSSVFKLADGVVTKDGIIAAIMRNSSVLFQWCLLSVDLEEEEGEELLHKMVELYVTMRGFSFARSLLEQYKQSKQKATLKSKSLRKTLRRSEPKHIM